MHMVSPLIAIELKPELHRRGRQLCLLTLQCVTMDGPLENEGLLNE